jgi:hypothetical protein
VQNVFHNWMSRLAWTTDNGGQHIVGYRVSTKELD